ncbi:MAG: hypothetical protein HOW73_19565 [Polyangiaceae bacterium]|nr:hypothetical protein [Polyangiaceae bacterium]
MSTWKCPGCDTSVPDYLVSCASCGYDRSPLSSDGRADRAPPSMSGLADPAVSYPWLARGAVLFRVFGYITLILGLLKMVGVLYTSLDHLDDALQWLALFFGLVGWGVAVAISVVILFILSDASAALLGVHRRLNVRS